MTGHEPRGSCDVGAELPTERILRTVLRELDQTLVPELRSDRARTVATLAGRLLRHVIVRTTGLDGLLRDWAKEQEELLGKQTIDLPREMRSFADRARRSAELLE